MEICIGRRSVVDSVGTVVQELNYSDNWHAATDGNGPSLTRLSVQDDSAEANRADAWTISLGTNGTPGKEDRVDLQNDGSLNIADVDLICAQLESSDPRLDFNEDGAVNDSDLATVLEKTFQSVTGDVNLDGRFDSDDLIRVLQAGKFEDDVVNNAKWSEGDWNCDGDFTTRDFVFVFQAGTFVSEASPAATPLSWTGISSSISAALDSEFDREQQEKRASHRPG